MLDADGDAVVRRRTVRPVPPAHDDAPFAAWHDTLPESESQLAALRRESIRAALTLSGEVTKTYWLGATDAPRGALESLAHQVAPGGSGMML
jgi:hypothetical protein